EIEKLDMLEILIDQHRMVDERHNQSCLARRHSLARASKQRRSPQAFGNGAAMISALAPLSALPIGRPPASASSRILPAGSEKCLSPLPHLLAVMETHALIAYGSEEH